MNVRSIVGVSLIAFLVLAGNILIFGLVENFNLFYFLFTFTVLFLIAITVGSRSVFEFVFSLVFILAVSLSITYCAISIKTLYDDNRAISQSKDLVLSDIKNMESMSEYYMNYSDYLQKNVQAIEMSTIKLQSDIDNVSARLNEPRPQQAPQVVYVPYQVPAAAPVNDDILYEYEREREEYD
jgi:hypothetical protein